MKVRSSIIACACATALLAARSHGADVPDIGDLSIEELMDLDIESVYGASRYEQRVTLAPSSISIVTAEEIRRSGHTSFDQVLRNVRGLYVTDDRNYTYLGIRGFNRPGDYNTRVLVLIDGHRLNDNIYDSGSIGRDAMIDVELIERVEVIRGPSSSVYGSSAFFGVINVVTKQGSQVDGVELAQDVSSSDTYRTRVTHGSKSENGIDWLASATHYSSQGADRLYYPDFDQRISDNPLARADGLAIDLDDEEAAKIFTSVRAGSFSASAYYSERSKQVPTASYASVFGDPNNRTTDTRGYVDVAFSGELGAGLQYHARAFYDRYQYEGALPYDWAAQGDPAEIVLFRDISSGEWLGGEAQLTGTFLSAYTFVVGAKYRANVREDQAAYDDLETREYYIDDESSSDTIGVFAQTEATLRHDLHITAGLRYDRYNDGVGSTINPRVAAIYNPSQRSALKLLYGEAFRAPNPYERYYFETQRLQPPLKPETIRTYETVYEHYLGSRYRIGVSVYQYEIDGLISQTETDTGSIYFDNLESVRARGVELELEARFEFGLFVRGSHVLQRSKDDTTGKELTSSPHQLGKLNLSAPIGLGIYSNLELQYHSSSHTLAGRHTPDFMLTNLSLTTAQLWPNVELSAGIYNALDVNHVYPAAEEHIQDSLRMNGRTYHGKLLVRF